MTGTGKSSFAGLDPALLYDPQQGRILADGNDLRDLDLDAYRRQIGIVYQESFLFSNTVAANIVRLAIHTRPWDQIERAARIAAAHDFIIDLPHGYRNGAGRTPAWIFLAASRQRLALARALLLQPPILILDDPTASVDARTENEIVSALARGNDGAHDVCGFQPVEFVAAGGCDFGAGKNGRLTQMGSHDELVHRLPYNDPALLPYHGFTKLLFTGRTRRSARAVVVAGVPPVCFWCNTNQLSLKRTGGTPVPPRMQALPGATCPFYTLI